MRTITVCDIQTLSKGDLNDLLSFYPYERGKIQTLAEKRFSEKKDKEKSVLVKVIETMTASSQKKKLVELLRKCKSMPREVGGCGWFVPRHN